MLLRRDRSYLKHQFRRKHIDYERCIQEFYIDKGLAYIFCKIDSWDQVINHYSVPGYECLNQELAQYLRGHSRFVPLEYPLVLILNGRTSDPDEQRVAQNAVKDYFTFELGEAQEALRSSRKHTITMFLSGAVFFLFCVLCEIFQIFPHISSVFNLLFWFFWLEAATELWLRRRDLLAEKEEIGRLASTQIVFREVFRDEPLSPEEREAAFQKAAQEL